MEHRTEKTWQAEATAIIVFIILPTIAEGRGKDNMRAGVSACRGRPWPLFLPLVGGANPSSPVDQQKNALSRGRFV